MKGKNTNIVLLIPEKKYGDLAILAAKAGKPIDAFAVEATTSTTSEKP